jgi:hypothetical protein
VLLHQTWLLKMCQHFFRLKMTKNTTIVCYHYFDNSFVLRMGQHFMNSLKQTNHFNWNMQNNREIWWRVEQRERERESVWIYEKGDREREREREKGKAAMTVEAKNLRQSREKNRNISPENNFARFYATFTQLF